MYFVQVSVTLLALVGYVIATGYGSGGYGGGTSTGGASYKSGPSGSNAPPKPYKFDYNNVDEQGNVQFRSEQGDASGNVKGTYGFNDVQGLFRIVEYVAGKDGFRAKIKTNEPGVDGKESPADVELIAEQSPSGFSSAQYNSPPSAPKSSYGGSGKSGY